MVERMILESSTAAGAAAGAAAAGAATGAAAGAGLLSFLLGRLLTPHLGETVCALLGFAASFLLYWGILSALRNFKEQELAAAQAGPVLKLIAKAFPRVNV